MLNLLTRRRAEAARVDTFLAAIRATAVPAPVRPLPVHRAGVRWTRTDTASLPRIIATAGSVLVAGAVLAGCAQAPASTVTGPTSAPVALELGLPVAPEAVPAPVQTGTDAGLITDPAPGFELEEPTSASTTTAPPAPAAVPTVHPAPVLEPAPVVDPPAAAPVTTEPSCAAGEELDPTVGCVAVQLPEEHVGGARCEDPAQVVVAVLEDGTAVCGTL